MADPPKRRLPILTDPAAPEDEMVDRPPWHWSAIGAVAVFLLWLPLAALVAAIVPRFLRTSAEGVADLTETGPLALHVHLSIIGLHLMGFVLASIAAGCIVGRFGGKAGPRQATMSGLLAALMAWIITASQGASRQGLVIWALLLIALGCIGACAAFLGGKLGMRLRPRGP